MNVGLPGGFESIGVDRSGVRFDFIKLSSCAGSSCTYLDLSSADQIIVFVSLGCFIDVTICK